MSCSYEDTTFGDMLTCFMSNYISYDTIGNPLSYYNGFTFSWEGRALVGATRGNNSYTFAYNDEGNRISKTVNGVKTSYTYDGDMLISEYGSDYTIIYLYDAEGGVIGMRYRTSSYATDVWDTYWYEKNIFGDIVAIYNNTGIKLISYTYDAWGNFSTTYHNGGANTTAAKNPFKYRGYYYDKDLGFYYLRTRYYDFITCRFISPDNADVITASPTALTDKNLYAYCDNNPIMRVDEDGEFWNWVIGGIVGGLVGGIVAAATGGGGVEIVVGIVSGVASGIVAATGLSWLAQAGISAAISASANFVNQTVDIIEDQEKTFSDYDISATIVEGVLGFATSAIGSGLGNLTGKYVTKTSKIANAAFDSYLEKTFNAGMRAQAGRSSSALVRQAGRFMQKVIFFDNTTRGVSSVVGSIFSLWNLAR